MKLTPYQLENIRLQVWKAVTSSGGKPEDRQLDYYADAIQQWVENGPSDA